MRRATIGLWPLLLLVGVAAASAGQNPPASADAQKLEAAWASLRARNARDYAIATPNGIDEAPVRRGRRHPAVDHDSRRRQKQPGAALSSRRTGRRDQPVGLCRVQVVVEALHGGPMGSARRRQNIRKEPGCAAAGHHGRAHDAGRRRARRRVAQATAEGQDHSRRPLVGIDPWRPHGEGAARPLLRVRWHGPGGRPGDELHRGI